MVEYVITFTSSGDAVGAEAVLAEAGLNPAVMPLIPQLGTGCGFCLRLKQPELQPALSLLHKAEIENSVYERHQNSAGFEYKLKI